MPTASKIIRCGAGKVLAPHRGLRYNTSTVGAVLAGSEGLMADGNWYALNIVTGEHCMLTKQQAESMSLNAGEDPDWDLVHVVRKGASHYRIACECYYSCEGVFALDVTHPLSEALRIYGAALAFAGRVESGDEKSGPVVRPCDVPQLAADTGPLAFSAWGRRQPG